MVAHYEGRPIPAGDHKATDAQARFVAVLPWCCTPWRCWQDLAGERGHELIIMGGGFGPILGLSYPSPLRWTALDQWCTAHGLNEDDRDFVIHCVQAMDQHWRNLKAEQNQQSHTRVFRK